MAVARLMACEWRDGRRIDHVITAPTLAQVEAAVRRLDNAAFNDLYLEASADDLGTYLCVGGGAGRYLLTGAIANERFPTLVDPQASPEPVQSLVVGGQAGDYPGNWIHRLETALDAARVFWSGGRFDGTTLPWVDT